MHALFTAGGGPFPHTVGTAYRWPPLGGRAGGVLNLKLGKLSERLCHRDRNVRTLRVGSIFTFSFQKKGQPDWYTSSKNRNWLVAADG